MNMFRIRNLFVCYQSTAVEIVTGTSILFVAQARGWYADKPGNTPPQLGLDLVHSIKLSAMKWFIPTRSSPCYNLLTHIQPEAKVAIPGS